MQPQRNIFIAPVARLIRNCKRRKFQFACADSTGLNETGGSLLTRVLVLRRLLRREVLDSDEQNVGILIPPSVGGAIANLALAVDQRIAVNLNNTLSCELINHCIRKAKLKHCLTTRSVMKRLGFELECEVVYLEEIAQNASGVDKAICALEAYAVPSSVLQLLLGLSSIKPEDVLTILFTSGTTGVPKGVMLTQRGIGTNVDAIQQVSSLRKDDVLIGVLPFFHAMGYTVGIWAAATCNVGVAYHLNPLEARAVGKLTEKYGGTILVATPTFLRSYLRRCTPEQFRTLDVVVTGAERLPRTLGEQFEEKFGVRPVEGYGATELSPLAAVNVPPSRQTGQQPQAKEGTVGRPIASVATKVTDFETGEEVAAGNEGELWISGPNVMHGYLDQPEVTAEVIENGWYKTGDMAVIDDDGFIRITGRVARFSKIGGEMVPHETIENVLTEFLEGRTSESVETPLVAVTALTDEKKGERLVVLHTGGEDRVEEMRQACFDAQLPNLYIPSARSFLHVDSLPLLGTGKVDLKRSKEIAKKLIETESD